LQNCPTAHKAVGFFLLKNVWPEVFFVDALAAKSMLDLCRNIYQSHETIKGYKDGSLSLTEDRERLSSD